VFELQRGVYAIWQFGFPRLGFCGCLLVFLPDANAQCKGTVVGTWKLVSVKATTDKGDMDKAVLGQNPSG
jgi:hypothetical protein